MKKLLIVAAMVIFLSSCTMYPNRRSDDEIFFGDRLIETKEIPRAKKVNSSFIYNYEDDHKDDECLECQIEDNE